jgi:hypothetical protein
MKRKMVPLQAGLCEKIMQIPAICQSVGICHRRVCYETCELLQSK